MQSDNEYSATYVDNNTAASEDQQEKTLQWLLEKDYSEPSEKLFTLEEEKAEDSGLTEYEAAVANRPMFGGTASADDLSSFVGEEIVMTAPGQSTGIYSTDEQPATAGSGFSADTAQDSMTIEHSRNYDDLAIESESDFDEGFDILGLADDDDIGERFMVLQKGKSRNVNAASTAAAQGGKEVPAPVLGPVDDEEPAVAMVAESTPAAESEALEIEAIASTDVEAETLSLISLEEDEAPSLEVTDLSALADEDGLLDTLDDVVLEDVVLEDVDPQFLSGPVTAEVKAEAFDEPLPDLPVFDGNLSDGADPSAFLASGSLEEEQPTEEFDVDSILLDSEEAELDFLDVIADETADSVESELELADEELEVLASDDADTELDQENACVEPEQRLSAQDIVDTQQTTTAKEYDVFDYVAANEPPLDDDDFDEYLLRGEHFDKRDSSVEELVVDRTEGVASVDPQLETTINFHEDFQTTEGLSGKSIAAVAGVIAQLMNEVSETVGERLQSLGAEISTLDIDFMLGTDAQSIAQCQAENYVPVSQILPQTPVALSGLPTEQANAVFLSFSHKDVEADWNALFADDFELNPGEANEAEASAEEAALDFILEDDDAVELETEEFAAIEPAVDSSAEMSLGDVFDEDIFSAELSDDFAVPESDIDEEIAVLGSDFEVDDELPGSNVAVGEANIFEDDIFEDTSLDMVAESLELLEDIAAESTESTEPEALLEAVEQAPDAAVIEEEPDNIFDEDIFGADFSDDLDDVESSASGEDVDAMFAELVDGESNIDQFSAVAVEEFSPSEVPDIVEAVEVVAVDEAVLEEAPESTDSDLSWCVPEHIKFSTSSEGGSDIFADFLDAFIEEGASELEKLEDAFGEWEKDVTSEVAYAPVPRILHTLKGIAKGVGLQRYGTFVHNFETLLEKFDRPEEGQEQQYFRVLNAWLDFSVRGFEHIESERTDIESELPSSASAPVVGIPVVAPVVDIEETDTDSVESAAMPAVAKTQFEDKKKDKQLADEGAKVLAAQQTIRMTPEALDRLMSLTNEAQQLGVRSSQSTVRSKRAAAELLNRLSSVRAHVSKIADKALLNVTAKGNQASGDMDALEMDQYSELQEAANILREGVEDLDDLIHLSSRQNTVAEALLKQQASSLSSLSSSIQAARVIPVSRMMPGLRRIVRTVSADLGKAVSFRVLNEFGTLDRDNHARCQTILEHMVRNALDHGIEKPDVRVAAGKDATGNITIDASKQGADYIVTLTDDGKGIDPEFMRDMAYEKGLDIDVDALSDAEAIRLIFHKGFSTANKVSEISGRGVGMDIVLSELQHIGGDIDIESTVGEGTTFVVRIPSNVTVNGALLVAAGEVSYAIPLDGLIAVEHVPVSDFYEAISSGNTLSLFGMECEAAYLATICHGDSLPASSSWGATVPVIIAGNEQRYMAIAIDDVAQALELVIRSLGAQFATIPGLAGGATTADGQSIVALNLNELVESAPEGEQTSGALRQKTEERMLVLVVDDSRTQRMVATSQFDTLGVETVTAENGLVAIDLLNTTHRLPDVVLLDIEMPVKDGIQTLREIRKSDRYSDLPVIMVTSRTGAKHRSLAEEAGCNGYMGKPFNFPKLVEEISELTNHKFQLS